MKFAALASLAAGLGLLAAAPATAATVYSTAPGLAANQTWTGTLGLDFHVNTKVRVFALGAFDSSGDGIVNTLTTVIFNSAGVAVTPSATFTNLAGNGDSFRFSTLVSFVDLAPGDYQLASWGYDGTNGNYNNSGPGGPIQFDSIGGALTALGTRYANSAGSLATIPDSGTTRYGAGSFIGAAVPEPASWALMIGGFGLVGAVSRRRRAVFA